MPPGRLHGLGIGPGDPELLTLKALRLLQSAPVVAYPVSDSGKSVARSIVADYLKHAPLEVPMYFPFKPDQSAQPYYDQAAATLAQHLSCGQDVAVLCEGDPFFYGSFMYLFTRLSDRFVTEVSTWTEVFLPSPSMGEGEGGGEAWSRPTSHAFPPIPTFPRQGGRRGKPVQKFMSQYLVPGVSSVMASASVLEAPLTYRNDVFVVLSAILPAEVLASRLAVADTAVIIKLGKHFAKVYEALKQVGLLTRARYIQCATMPNQCLVAIEHVDPTQAPYFSMIVIPSQWKAEG